MHVPKTTQAMNQMLMPKVRTCASSKNPLTVHIHCDFITDCVGWNYFLSVPLSMEIFTFVLNLSNRKQNIPIICVIQKAVFLCEDTF